MSERTDARGARRFMIFPEGRSQMRVPSPGKLALYGAHAMGLRSEIVMTPIGYGVYRAEVFVAGNYEPSISIRAVGEREVDHCVKLWSAWGEGRDL